MMLVAATFNVMAQRFITPIETPATVTQHINENSNPDSLDRSKLVEMTDAQGRTILVDTVAGTEIVDSAALRVVPKMEQPLFYAVTVGVNVWSPLMRLFGQKYGLIDFSAELNLHNRYIPVFEFGLGMTDDTPEDNNYTYKSKLSPYFKIGMNYNFLYNSNPDYMAMAGVRYGFSPFSFSVTDVTVDSPYWKEETPMTIPTQNATASYFELLFNLRVRVGGPIYLGWSFIFHKLLRSTTTPYGQPWYIPGFGSRDNVVTGAFTVTCSFDLHKKKRDRRLPGTDEPTLYPPELPELPPNGDPTVTPHYHPSDPADPETCEEEAPLIILE